MKYLKNVIALILSLVTVYWMIKDPDLFGPLLTNWFLFGGIFINLFIFLSFFEGLFKPNSFKR